MAATPDTFSHFPPNRHRAAGHDCAERGFQSTEAAVASGWIFARRDRRRAHARRVASPAHRPQRHDLRDEQHRAHLQSRLHSRRERLRRAFLRNCFLAGESLEKAAEREDGDDRSVSKMTNDECPMTKEARRN